MGDVDDRRIMTPAFLGDPDAPGASSAALSLARRFGAPAVAEVLSDGHGGIRVWMWRPGMEPTTAAGNAGADGGRAAGMDLVVSLAGRHGDVEAAVPGASDGDQEEASRPSQVDVEEHPEFAQDGGFGFAVVLASQDAGESAMVRRAVAGIEGVSVASSIADEDGAVVTGSYTGDRNGLVAALAAAGVRVSDD